MAQFPFLPLWTDAYLADTTHLTTQQHGAYLLMLMTAWRDPDCHLQDDDRFLAKITRMTTAAWRRNSQVLLTFWQEEDGFLYQKRLRQEREKIEERSKKAKHAAEAKWLNKNDTGDANAGAEQCSSDASISITTSIPRTMNQNSYSDEKITGIEGKVGSLKSITYEQARKIAPGYDIYYLENRWREWSSDKVIRNPDHAYLAFLRKHVEQNPL